MQLITGLSRQTVILSILVEVVDGAEDKEDHSFLETPLIVYALLVWEFQMMKQSKLPAFNHNKSFGRV